MLFIGPISSVFDFLTFYVLLHVFHASEPLFHTGWFVESLATQTLVLFVIRTQGNPFTSRPSVALTLTTLAVVAASVLLPWTPLAHALGFVAPPLRFGAFVASATVAYLALVQVAKVGAPKSDAARRENPRPGKARIRQTPISPAEIWPGGPGTSLAQGRSMVSAQPRVERFIEIVHDRVPEMPGLQLTKPQMRRFLGVDVETCDVVLDLLEQEKFLRRTPKDAYVLQS